MHTLSFTTPAIVLAFAVVASPWVFLILFMHEHRRQERLWRETLVYLKSASAFEAEDAIDRVERRDRTAIERGLAKFKKQGDNLSEEAPEDMATDMRSTLTKKYQ